MAPVLFLGNSHLSAFRLAYDRLISDGMPHCRFFCAKGADLAFTAIEDGHIVPKLTADIDRDLLSFAYSDSLPEDMIEFYTVTKRPMEKVAQQFEITGGASLINLRGVEAVFYVVGVSPYDFIRLRESPSPITVNMRKLLLNRMLDEKFIMRKQIQIIKATFPRIRHYFIGMPLLAEDAKPLEENSVDIISNNREIISSLAGSFLFDDVFMPSSEVLNSNLMSTRMEFARGGNQQSQSFQGDKPTISDNSHMNDLYGSKVFQTFVLPKIFDLHRSRSRRSILNRAIQMLRKSF